MSLLWLKKESSTLRLRSSASSFRILNRRTEYFSFSSKYQSILFCVILFYSFLLYHKNIKPTIEQSVVML